MWSNNRDCNWSIYGERMGVNGDVWGGAVVSAQFWCYINFKLTNVLRYIYYSHVYMLSLVEYVW